MVSRARLCIVPPALDAPAAPTPSDETARLRARLREAERERDAAQGRASRLAARLSVEAGLRPRCSVTALDERCPTCRLVLVALPSGEVGCAWCATAETRALGREMREAGTPPLAIDAAGQPVAVPGGSPSHAAMAAEIVRLLGVIRDARDLLADDMAAAARAVLNGRGLEGGIAAERETEREWLRVEVARLREALAKAESDRDDALSGEHACAGERDAQRGYAEEAIRERDAAEARLVLVTAERDAFRAQLAERTAERNEVTAELDRLSAIVAEYATRETEPPASEPEPEPPAMVTALAVAIYAESHEVKGWDDCEAITHADHVEAIVRVRAGYASAKLDPAKLFYDVDAVTGEQLEELAYNTLTSLVRAAGEAAPW